MSNSYLGVVHTIGNPLGTMATERPKAEMFRPAPPSLSRITHRRAMGLL